MEEQFLKIAHSIDTPLSLAALGLLVLYGVYRLLIRAGVFPPVLPGASGALIGRMINWVGVLALVGLVLVLAKPYVLRGGSNTDEVNQLLNAMTAAYSQNLFDDADRKAHEVLQIDPTNPRALNMEGAVAFYRKDYRSATDNFSASLKLRNDPVVTMNLADSYVEVGGYEKAVELYHSIDDGKSDVSYALGRAYLYEDNYKEALKLLQPVPTNFNHGSARVSEAAALVGMANHITNTSQRASLLSKASDKLREGLGEDTKFWEGIFDGNATDIHEGHSKQTLLLGSLYQKMRKG